VPLILFGANKGIRNRSKGFSFLESALAPIAANMGLHLAIAGADESQRKEAAVAASIHFLGLLNAEQMADAYRAADLFVLPSMHETLPNMVAEAMACGRPVVAFRVGGLPDMIDHGVNGYLARPFEASDIGKGILLCLDSSQRAALRQAARVKAESMFDTRRAAQRYLDIYRRTLEYAPLRDKARTTA
jgi:glycosyltransferase involved in cell wall biosynthesis